MDTQITDQPTAHLAVPLVQQAQIVLIGGKALVVAVVKYGQATAEVALDAALADRGHHAVEKKYISENETVPLASISAMESCVP